MEKLYSKLLHTKPNTKAFLIKAFVFIIGIFLYSNQLEAQTTPKWYSFGKRNGVTMRDTTKRIHLHSPSRAAFLSAIVPGLGQAYNRKYWKIPIVYGAIGTSLYFIKFNTDEYNKYHKGFIAVSLKDSVNDPFQGKYNAQQLDNAQEYYRRNRDLAYVFTALFYVMNIIDANVDAHLFYFNVNDNIGLKIEPQLFNSYSYGRTLATPGISFTFNFK